MAVRNTSKAAYKEAQPHIGPQQEKVLEFIKLNPGLSRKEIGRELEVEPNVVTARIKELLDGKYVEESGYKKTCSITGKMVNHLRPYSGGVKPKGPPKMAKIVGRGHITVPHETETGFIQRSVPYIDLKLSDGRLHSRITREVFDREIKRAVKAGLCNNSDLPVKGENIKEKHLAIYDQFYTKDNGEQVDLF